MNTDWNITLVDPGKWKLTTKKICGAGTAYPSGAPEFVRFVLLDLQLYV